jgi:peroxiredoxin
MLKPGDSLPDFTALTSDGTTLTATFERLGARIVGVSTDEHSTQCAFAQSLRLPYPLIGDHDRLLAKKFGVLWPLLGVARRASFVVDAQGVVRGVEVAELHIEEHLQKALRLVENLPRAAS